jgi:flagellar hook-associated protein 1 FlgK
MSGLTSSLLIAVHALGVQDDALNTTTNNIANANTPGYARQRADLAEAQPVEEAGAVYGQGVDLQRIESIRDQLIELQLHNEAQQQGSAQAQLSALQQVENQFSDADAGIGAQLNNFFSSLSQLSADPTSVSYRQGIMTAAQNLVSQFKNTAGQLVTIQQNLDTGVSNTINDINRLLVQIAQVNGMVQQKTAIGQDPGALEDQRIQLVRQLASLTDVKVIQTEQGETLTTANGSPLVVGNKSFQLATQLNAAGFHSVTLNGQEITASITAGKLGGLLQVRDGAIPNFSAQLDTFAFQFVQAVNNANHQGFTTSGTPGPDIFTPPATSKGAAEGMSLATTDPQVIAASIDGTPGSSGNLQNLLQVQSNALPMGQSPTEAYANLVFQAGSAVANAKASSDASDLVMQQLSDQRASVSGVSLDEESANLIRYQRAYQACARVVTTVDELTQVVLAMGTSAAQ